MQLAIPDAPAAPGPLGSVTAAPPSASRDREPARPSPGSGGDGRGKTKPGMGEAQSALPLRGNGRGVKERNSDGRLQHHHRAD